MPNLGTPEIIIIALVIVLLFGAKKLPDAARGLGRSLRIFKAETKGLRDDDAADEQPRPALPPTLSSTQPSTQPPAQQQSTPQGPQVAPPLEHDAKRDR
jgi:sec-independent protein translocase protein TatA